MKKLNKRVSQMLQTTEGIHDDFKDRVKNHPKLLDAMLPDDILGLPGWTINWLIEEGHLIDVQEAVSHSGYASRNTIYTAQKSERYPLKHIIVGDSRGVYYLRWWIDDYMENRPRPGRPVES